jgi:TPR repeat protein
MGRRYEAGQGVPQNYFEATKWYRLAAEQGYATAQYNLGMMYKEGRGVPPDFVQAYFWLSLAASGFPTSEAKNRNSAIRNRDLLASRLSPAQLAEAQRLAREWKPKTPAP